MAIFSIPLRAAGVLLLLCLRTSGQVVLDSLEAVPAGWTKSGTPNSSTTITLQVALTQQNLGKLESHLASVSTPGSASYGKYLSLADITSTYGASTASQNAVTTWLTSSGVTNYTIDSDSVWFTTTIASANSILGTTFNYYTDSVGATKLRTTKYSVPQSVAAAVDLIAPTTFFGKTVALRLHEKELRSANHVQIARRKTNPIPEACRQNLTYGTHVYHAITPDCLKIEYNINNYSASASSGSRIGYGSFLNQSSSFSDLALFENNFGISKQNFSVVLVNPEDGATDLPQPPSNANDGEANLDVQYLVGIGHPLPVTEFITAGSPPYIPDPAEPIGTPNENEPYLPYFQFLLSKKDTDLPQVITNSYGDEEQTVPKAYAKRVCNLIGLLGLRGVTVLESSGDEGVGASCLSRNGKKPQFNPIFPATCPYILSVGGLIDFQPEKAWAGSSGGFSYIFPAPWYQNATTTAYITDHVSADTQKYYGKYVDFTGRGFPDVSALSITPDYTVYQGGIQTPSGGTSAAAPVTAAIIALLNDARLKVGKPSLGFINPLLYSSMYKGFVDVTLGQSVGCNGYDTQTGSGVPGSGSVPGAYWNATVGWDPVTGFGYPDFQKLLTIVLSV